MQRIISRKTTLEEVKELEQTKKHCRIGLIPFCVKNDQQYYFFGESRDNWSCDWGGTVDPRETSLRALARELREEATTWAKSLMKYLAFGKPAYFVSETATSMRVLIILQVPNFLWKNVKFWSSERLHLKVVHQDALHQFLQESEESKLQNRGVRHFAELLSNGLIGNNGISVDCINRKEETKNRR